MRRFVIAALMLTVGCHERPESAPTEYQVTCNSYGLSTKTIVLGDSMYSSEGEITVWLGLDKTGIFIGECSAVKL